MISYYTTDYDMYERMTMAGMSTNNADAGPVYDMSESLDDLAILEIVNDTRDSDTWERLQERGKNMTHFKNTGGECNRWHLRQTGGQGDPYFGDLDGFVEALEIQIQAGIKVCG